MRIVKRLLLAAALTWAYSMTLGFIFAVHWNGQFHFNAYLNSSAYIAPLVFSSICATLVTPVAFWSIGNGVRKHLIYGPILWVIIAVFECVAPPVFNLAGAVLIAVLGLVALRVIPVTQKKKGFAQ